MFRLPCRRDGFLRRGLPDANAGCAGILPLGEPWGKNLARPGAASLQPVIGQNLPVNPEVSPAPRARKAHPQERM